jgi:hypothetical protein
MSSNVTTCTVLVEHKFPIGAIMRVRAVAQGITA